MAYLIVILHNLIYFIVVLPFYLFKWVLSLLSAASEKLKRENREISPN